MLSSSLHRVVQHYIFVLEQLHIAGEFEDGSIRRLPRRQAGLRTVFRIDEDACRPVRHGVGRECRRSVRAIP